jgi:hypothetical protein
VEKIEAERATTLAGLQVKARALQWCRSGEPLTPEDLSTVCASSGHVYVQPPTTDRRLIVGIVADLADMTDAQQVTA